MLQFYFQRTHNFKLVESISY